jgi:hypothetical protein
VSCARSSNAVFSALAALVLVLVPHAARAESDEEAKTRAAVMLNEGNKFFEQKDYARALARYEAAYALYPSPKLYYSLGRARHALGHTARAAEYYEQFLVEAGVEYRSPLYEKAQTSLNNLMSRLGKIRVVEGVPGAKITVDGNPAATLPSKPIFVEAGARVVSAELAGYLPFEAKVNVEPGRLAPLKITMVPMRVVTATKAVEVCEAPPPPPRLFDLELPAKRVEVKEDDGSVFTSWWFWTAIGVAAAGATAAAFVATRGGGAAGDELGESALADWERL